MLAIAARIQSPRLFGLFIATSTFLALYLPDLAHAGKTGRI